MVNQERYTSSTMGHNYNSHNHGVMPSQLTSGSHDGGGERESGHLIKILSPG